MKTVSKTPIKILASLSFIVLVGLTFGGTFSTRASSDSDIPFFVKTIEPQFLDSRFYAPNDVAINDDGDFIVVDPAPFIKKYSASGTYLTTIDDGTTSTAPTAVKIGSDDKLYIADASNVDIYSSAGIYQTSFGEAGTDDGQFNNIRGLDVSTSTIYVVDNISTSTDRFRVQEFDLTGNFIKSWGESGTGDGQSNLAWTVVVTATNIFLSDTANSRIQKFDLDGVFVSEFGTTGDGTLTAPYDMDIDSDGNLYVQDEGDTRIIKYSPAGEYVDEFAGSFRDIGVNGNKIAICNYSLNQVDVYNLSGTKQLSFGYPNSTGPGDFSSPYGVTANQNGDIFVADYGHGLVQIFDSNGVYKANLEGDILGEPIFNSAISVVTDTSGNIYVDDDSVNKVIKFNSSYAEVLRFGGEANGGVEFDGPAGLTIDTDGNVYVADSGNAIVQKYNSAGEFVLSFDASDSTNGAFAYPYAITCAPNGEIYVVDLVQHRVVVFNSDGEFIREWGSSGVGEAELVQPVGVAVDSTGRVVISDSGVMKFKIFTSTGTYINEWGELDEGGGGGPHMTSAPGSNLNVISKAFAAEGDPAFSGMDSIFITTDNKFIASDPVNNLVHIFQWDRVAPTTTLASISSSWQNISTYTVIGTTTDSLSNISAVQVQLDGTSGSWTACSATDSAFDEKSELFSCPISGLTSASHTVYVRSTDSYTNSTTTTATLKIDRSAPAGDIVINGGNARTNSRNVTLGLSATDAHSGVADMMLSESSSFTGASWVAYATSTTFTISDEQGITTVYARFRDVVGNISPSDSDSIDYYAGSFDEEDETDYATSTNDTTTTTDATTTPTDTTVDQPSSVTTEILFVDQNSKPLVGAVVTIDGVNYTTDAYGKIYVKNMKGGANEASVQYKGNIYPIVISVEDGSELVSLTLKDSATFSFWWIVLFLVIVGIGGLIWYYTSLQDKPTLK